LILASASPRRQQLLGSSGMPFSAVPAGIDERPPLPLSPLRLALWAAEAKARAVALRFPDAVILAADTVVALDGRAYGKPGDAAEARETLAALSGRTHLVYTAVAVIGANSSQPRTGFSRTFVTMRELSRNVITRYLDSGEPQDKAGAYAIQGEGRRLVRAFYGPFDNVVGMPMHLVLRLLRESGMTVPAIKADGAEHEGETQGPRRSLSSHRRTDAADVRRTGSRRLRPGGQLAAGHNPEHRRTSGP
jgi:septum formation protein